VAAFEAAVEEDRPGEALDLYKGDLLDGFFLSDAPEFEKWLDGRRASLRKRAAEAAWALADRAEAEANGQEAAQWARRAAEYAPDDESTLQRLVGLLDRTGDRAAALRAYEAFAWRLENELGLEPSPETRALVEGIRARETTISQASSRTRPAPDAAVAAGGGNLVESARPDESLLAGAAAEVARTDEDEDRKKRRVGLSLALAGLTAAAVIVDGADITRAVAGWFEHRGAEPSASERSMPSSLVELDPRRIAVLYFDDHSENQELGYLANGLTESLIQQLSDVEALEVISRNGVKPYRNTDVTVDSIVKALRPGTLVEGSVIRGRDRIRVTVQLIDASDNSHLGSRTIERPEADVLLLLDDLSREVSNFLRERLGEEIRLREARSGTGSSEAWGNVQRAAEAEDLARNLAIKKQTDAALAAFGRADGLLAKAESLDPDWLEPTVRRGWVAFETAELGRPRPEGPALEEALGHAERACEESLNSPRALELRGTAHLYLGWHEADAEAAAEHYEMAQADLETAVAGDPMLARAWAELSNLYVRTGRYEEAEWAAERALNADAFLEQKKTIIRTMGVAALNAENFEAALRWARRGLAEYAEDPAFAGLQLLVLATGGETPPPVEEAWELVSILERKLGDNPNDPPKRRVMMAAVLARAGLPDSARHVIQRARDTIQSTRDTGSVDPYFAYYEATARLALGDRDTAIIRLGEYLTARPTEKANIANDWLWRPLSDDQAFQAIVAENN
jgi:serine/threonine-protein kinase